MEDSRDAEDTQIPGFCVVDSLTQAGKVKLERDTSDEKSLVESERDKPASDDDVTFVLDRDIEDIDEKVHQSTLIITTEDLLSATCDDTLNLTEKEERPQIVESKTAIEEPKKKALKAKVKREDHNYFWVSNITRHIKATDLKKYFSQLGKVLTAKILTNGKNYFGYVSMASPELAAKCIKQLNNTLFEGRRITVCKDRPDLREAKAAVKEAPRKKKIEPKKEEKVIAKEEAKPKLVELAEKKSAEDLQKSNALIADLQKKLDRAKADTSRYKYKVLEFQRRHEGMRKKCDSLERELKETQAKLREERRRLNQDREQFEKSKKLDQTRLDADRMIVKKELDEVKKLREHLKEKIEEIKQAKKPVKRRSRSPLVRSRNFRSRSPQLRSSSTSYRPEPRLEKKRKREEVSRGRTPPPPPKLSEIVGKKREVPTRYFGDAEKRTTSLAHPFEYRHHKTYPAPPAEVRAAWQHPFPKDPRRPGPSSSQSYPEPPRYGGGYQFPSSAVVAPPRSYYPEFGKPYGSY